MADALASGVGGLNLSVEDFQNVAAQLLSSQKINTTLDDNEDLHPATEDAHPSVSTEIDQSLQCFELVTSAGVRVCLLRYIIVSKKR